MKKTLLLMMVLFFGLAGSMKAQFEVVIGSGTTANNYLPTYELYNYSFSQQIYTADEIGIDGLINSISFNYAATSSTTRNLTIYLKHTTMSSFAAGTTWESVSASDIVFSGNIIYPAAAGWFEIPLNAPFAYNGTDNLLLCVDDNTGNWVGSKAFFAYTPEDGANRSKSIYSDGVNYDPYNPSSYSGAIRTVNNQIKLDMTVADGPIVTVNPNPIAMGPRPNGAWMRPFDANVSNLGLPVDVSAIDVTNTFFALTDMEFPMELNYGDTINFQISTGETTAGPVNAQLVVTYTERTADLIDLTATAYDPVSPDVWELARVVSSYPYTDVPSTGVVLYDNYLLPGNVQDGPDAVYELTFANDVLLTADVVGANGKAALYTPDFNGFGGPHSNNNYTGPTIGADINGGGDEMATIILEAHDVWGDGTGYQILFDQDCSTSAAITGNFVCGQSYSEYEYMLPENATAGDENVLVDGTLTMEIPAGTYDYVVLNPGCGGFGVVYVASDQCDASKGISVEFEAGQVYHFTATLVSPNDCITITNERGEIIGLTEAAPRSAEFMASAKVADMSLVMNKPMANRAETTLINEGFEGGAIPTGWTSIASSGANWYVDVLSIEGNDPAHTGTYAAFCDGTDYIYDNAYLVTSAIDLTNATAASLDYYYMNKAWGSDVNDAIVYYGASATGPWTELWSETTSHSTWTNNTIDLAALCGGTYYIAFASKDSYGYCTGFDDIVLTATTAAATAGLIDNMTVPAGTYYLAASSTDAGYTVNINAVAIPLPELASCIYPADGATEIASPVAMKWTLGEYTTEYQLVMGTTYPPTEVVIDWTSELAEGYRTATLLNNTTYFWRINEKNTTGTTTGDVWGFTTSLNIPQDLMAADNEIFEGENAVLNWTAVDRSHRGYNVYQDGVKINDNTVTSTTYTVAGLAYNMAPGYTFAVTAVYDEGESPISNEVRVFVSGEGNVSGTVYEQDSVTPIAGATVTLRGEDEFGDEQTYTYTTGANGEYTGALYAGVYTATASADGYQDVVYPEDVTIVYNAMTPDIDFIMNEVYSPVSEVIAEEIDDNMVKVYWSMNMMSSIIEDFETGDFSACEWNNGSSYPWAITTNNPYEGTYCMKSTCEGVTSGVSSIEVSMEIPRNALMSFYGKTSSESNYDKGVFYIDGAQQGSWSGAGNWTNREFHITEGTHTFKWSYEKDSSVNSNDDCFYVDYINFCYDPEPFGGEAWLYYDDGTNVDAVGLTAGGSLYWGIMFPAAELGQYAGTNLTKVSYFDYTAHTGNILIYQGGTSAPGTLVHTQAYTATGSMQYIEFNLTSPIPIDATQNLWIVMNNDNGQYVASACDDTGNPNGRWISTDGATWDDVAALGLSYTWNLRGFVTNGRGATSVLANDRVVKTTAVNYVGKSTPNGVLTTDPNAVFTNAAQVPETKDRAFAYYNVWRTDCYNTEYTEENTTLLASHVTDTLYMDMSWANTQPGVYKWGVSRVYEGNRESRIAWNEGKGVISADAERSPMAPVKAEMGNRAPWDLVNSFNLSSAGQQGVATDGDFIYTCSWQAAPTGGYSFYKYDLEGTFVEGFNITGVSAIRDLTYDGQYFYGGSGSGTLYTIDLANKALVGSTSTGVSAIRHCSYDADNDGFWIGNWTDCKLVDRTGAVIQNGPTPSSAYSSGYFVDDNGEAHLYLFCQPNSDAKVYDYNITTGTLNSTPIFDFASTPGFNTGSAGGSFVGVYQGKNCFFGNCQQDPNLVGIYELSAATGGGGGNTGLVGERESEIVWSNCIDKDMITTVDVTATTNSLDPVTGAMVTLTNISEPEMGFDYTTTLDETGYYAWNEFRKGTYLCTISLEGFASCYDADTMVIMEPTSIECMLEELIYGVSDLYVSHTGWAMWEGNGSIGGGGGGTGDAFTESFDNGLNGWTNIDADGDGEVFYPKSECESMHCVLTIDSHSGTGHLCSESYCNCTGALNPNNFLVSPQKYNIGGGSTFSFYACAQDAGYAAEHFGVAISTSGNTSAADFTTIQEWTLTAKGGREAEAGATRDGKNRVSGAWYQFTADLSAYAGQQVWIAIRHFNVSDQFLMCVDDVELSSGAKGDRALEEYKVMLDGVFESNTTNNFFQHDVTNLVPGQEYTTQVAAVYSTGMSDWSEYTWVYQPCEDYAGTVDGVTGEWNNENVVLSWEYPGSVTPPTPPTPGTGDEFFYDFENGTLGDWTTIDADGDGINWLLGAAPGVSGNNGSGYCVYSESYRNVPLTPDNYIVSPRVSITNGSTLSFYACGQDASYAAEHYGVAISTTGNTNASDFTTIWEETMTAKGERYSDKPRGSRVQGTWYHKTVDLSAYAGQEVYIAFRHFNCTDMFYLDVDDITLSAGGKAGRSVLFQQNEMITHAGQGANGADASAICGESAGAVNFGPNANWALGNGTYYLVADDFTLDAASTITNMKFYAYQTGSGNNSTMTGLYMQIYDGDPMNGGQVVWGDNATNLLSATSFTNIYRVSVQYTGLTDVNRPIMALDANDLNISLEAGTYWVSVGFTGSAASGPWAVPVSVWDESASGNGIQKIDSGWQLWMDAGQKGLPMIIEGTGGGGGGGGTAGEILGAVIFRDGEYIGFTEENTYTDANPEMVDHNYCVRVVYDGPMDGTYYSMSCPECVDVVADMTCDAPELLNGTYQWNAGDDFGALISWGEQVEAVSEWLYYDNGTYASSIGAGGTVYWGIKFEASDLANYAGCSMTEVSLYDSGAGTYVLNVYYGGAAAPQTLVHTQNLTLTGSNDWFSAQLTSALPIDATQPLWITFYNTGVTYPASGSNFTGNNNGAMVSIDGMEWMDISTASGGQLSYTWMIRGYVTNAAKGGEVVALPAFEGGKSESGLSAINVEPRQTMAPVARALELESYKVYRSTTNSNYQLIATVPAVAGQTYYEYYDEIAIGTYYYQVTAYYTGTNGDCESEPAMSEMNPSNNYVVVNVTTVGEEASKTSLYPNPTSGNVTIEAAGMNHITVVSALGQVVYDSEINSDNVVLNMAQYTAGVYMVRIATENGVSVKRVTVVR